MLGQWPLPRCRHWPRKPFGRLFFSTSSWHHEVLICFLLIQLVCGWKNMLVKLDHFPRDWALKKKCLRPPPRQLLLHVQISWNGNLLAKSVAKKRGVVFPKMDAKIATWIRVWPHIINKSEVLYFNKWERSTYDNNHLASSESSPWAPYVQEISILIRCHRSHHRHKTDIGGGTAVWPIPDTVPPWIPVHPIPFQTNTLRN